MHGIKQGIIEELCFPKNYLTSSMPCYELYNSYTLQLFRVQLPIFLLVADQFEILLICRFYVFWKYYHKYFSTMLFYINQTSKDVNPINRSPFRLQFELWRYRDHTHLPIKKKIWISLIVDIYFLNY